MPQAIINKTKEAALDRTASRFSVKTITDVYGKLFC